MRFFKKDGEIIFFVLIRHKTGCPTHSLEMLGADVWEMQSRRLSSVSSHLQDQEPVPASLGRGRPRRSAAGQGGQTQHLRSQATSHPNTAHTQTLPRPRPELTRGGRSLRLQCWCWLYQSPVTLNHNLVSKLSDPLIWDGSIIRTYRLLQTRRPVSSLLSWQSLLSVKIIRKVWTQL